MINVINVINDQRKDNQNYMLSQCDRQYYKYHYQYDLSVFNQGKNYTVSQSPLSHIFLHPNNIL